LPIIPAIFSIHINPSLLSVIAEKIKTAYPHVADNWYGSNPIADGFW